MAYALSQGFRNIAYFFQNNELSEVILPFLLIFTLMFTVLQRLQLFGDKKNVSVMLALIMSLLTVIPHITGRYASNYDPITIINSLVPSAAVLAIVIVLLVFLLGIFGSEFLSGGAPGWAIIAILGILVYIFGVTVNWWTSPTSGSILSLDSDTSMTVVALLVLGAAIFFITGSEETKPLTKIWEILKGKH